MKRLFGAVVCAAACAALSGCLVPEKFQTSVQFKNDGGYTYKYEGTVVHYLAAAAIKEKGSLLPKDEAVLEREAEKASRAPGVKRMTYAGQGRYDVRIEQDLKPGQQVDTLKLFTITREKDGTFVVATPAIKEKDRANLLSLGIKVDGTAEVTLPGKAQVLSHNASKTPGLFSKSYAWKIGSLDDRPTIRFTMAR